MNLKKLALLTFLSTSATFAADCSPENQQFYESAAVSMMWSIRAWVCPNAWWQKITAGPAGDWCDASGGFTYSGSWTLAGVSSEQQCWDITEQIINQCMYGVFHTDNSFHVGNGGTWTWGSTYAGGWFWVDNGGVCKNHGKREALSLGEENIPLNYTLASGEDLPIDRQVWLDLDDPENVKLVSEVVYAS